MEKVKRLIRMIAMAAPMSIKQKNPKIVAILGPTASGKSALAVFLAKKFNGEIISADSRQVYRGFDLGAGKITKKEMQGVRHYLLDVASPKRNFTAAQYQKLARRALQDILKENKLPIVCGGAGFYVQTLLDGIAIPEVKPNFKLRTELRGKKTAELFQMLKAIDPNRAKNIDPKNPHRLIRALEIVRTLGRVPQLKINPFPAEILFIGIKKNKDELNRLIAERLNKRLGLGLLKEVKRLHARGLSWQRLEQFGLEYKYGALLLQNKITRGDFKKELVRASLKYAKRQMTWFKKDKRIHWVGNKNEALRLTKIFLQ